MTYQPQHEITISPYPVGDGDPFVFGATCACGWIRMPTWLNPLAKSIREHYVAVDFALPEGSTR